MRILFIILAVNLLVGCGSTKYTITTNPSGADIEVNKRPWGISPAFVKYSNSRDRNVPLKISLRRFLQVPL